MITGAETEEIGVIITPDYKAMYDKIKNEYWDLQDKYLELQDIAENLQADLDHKNEMVKNLLKGRVDKVDRKAWMTLRFGANIGQFAKEIFKSLV